MLEASDMEKANVTRAWTKGTLRGARMMRGLVESDWVVEIDDDKVSRRVYEDWNDYRKTKNVPLVVKIKGTLFTVDRASIDFGLAEADRVRSEFLAHLRDE
jgi:hypothetical protein